MLKANDLTVRYGDLTVLDGVDFSVSPGQWLMILGPNGAGKSTIVNAVSQGVPYGGTISFNGTDIRRIKPTERAKCFGVLTQNHFVGYSFTVGEIVHLGRYAYRDRLFTAGTDDEAAVASALDATGMTPFRDKSVLTLSGGELQRAFLAQLFAQNPKLLILDEPTNHLDLVYQRQVLDLIGEWLSEPDRSVISVVHDLSLAKAYGTHALLLNGGNAVAFGTVDEVLTRERLHEVYSMDVFGWMNKMLGVWQEETE